MVSDAQGQEESECDQPAISASFAFLVAGDVEAQRGEQDQRGEEGGQAADVGRGGLRPESGGDAEDEHGRGRRQPR